EILHQIFSRRPDIGEHGNLPGDPIEALDIEGNAGPARHRDHMNDGIGRAAHGHVDFDGVVEGGRGEDALDRKILPHHVDDAAAHMRGWLESAAGFEEAPGSVRPSASAIAIMVAAVPMTMQVPNERAMPLSISFHCSSVMRPARFSVQYFHTSEPEPRYSPR